MEGNLEPMRILIPLSTVFCLLLPQQESWAGGGHSISEPTPLQSLAMKPESEFVWSKEVTRIESTRSTATVSAIEVEGADGELLRGILVELENGEASDAFYIDGEHVRQFMSELAQLEPSQPPGESKTPCRAKNTCRGGVARCRPSQTIPQAYCPEFYTTADLEEGIFLWTPRDYFRFPWIRPSALFAAIAQATDALQLRMQQQELSGCS